MIRSGPLMKENTVKPYITKSVMLMHLTDYCNLGCPYCYADKSEKCIPPETARKAVDFFVDFSGGGRDDAFILFVGGEPLAAPKAMREIMAYARTRGIDGFGVITNAVLMDRPMMVFMAENRFFAHLSLDGVPEAQNATRPFLGGQPSFDRIDKNLDLLGEYADRFRHIEIRHTFSPDTTRLLADSVRYYASKKASRKARICFMPAMLPTGRWDASLKDGSFAKEIRKQLLEVADLCLERWRAGDPLHVYYNECLTNAPSLIESVGLGAYSCQPGGEHIAVNMEGDLFPCPVPAAFPGMGSNVAYKMGDVWKGVDGDAKARAFCGHRTNEHFSCPHWNRFETGDPAKPALVYTVIAAAWLEAIKKVRAGMRA